MSTSGFLCKSESDNVMRVLVLESQWVHLVKLRRELSRNFDYENFVPLKYILPFSYVLQSRPFT